MTFEDFHICAVRADRFLELLRKSGVRFSERVISEGVRAEYVIAVHPDDLDLAGEVLAKDIGLGRTFTSRGSA
jgi:hypothetical protein